MKIFVVGGTGLVGSYLLPLLIEKGNQVYALTRRSDKIERINKLGAQGIIGNIRNSQTYIEKIPDDFDIIVLLAMPSIQPGRRITKKRKEKLRSEIKELFRNSMDLAIEYDVPIILPSGTSFRTKNDEIADETWPIIRFGITEIGKDTDDMVDNAIKEGKPRVIQLLFGKIYGNGGFFRIMYEMMEKGRIKIIGKGDNCIPNIHAKDAATAIIKAIEKLPIGDKFIIADDTSVSQKDFTNYMADLMNRARPNHIPSFLIRMILGNDFYEIIRMNCKVSNNKAKRMLEWSPEYPSYKEGLEATVEEMKKGKNYFA